MNRHPWWYDQVKRDEFSGGDFISNFSPEKAGEAEYRFEATQAGEYTLWLRANPTQAALAYTLNGGSETPVNFTQGVRDITNVAADAKPDLRFLAWINAGVVTLKAGENTLRFQMTSPNSHHGYLDCFALANEPFTPSGKAKPGDALDPGTTASSEAGWFPFAPPADKFDRTSVIDLRGLNESFAGEHGWVQAQGGHFAFGSTGEAVRFWAVNGPPGGLDQAGLKQSARTLAKYGVNLVRLHGGMFDEAGEVSPDKIRHAQETVAAMRAEGIYSHLSIYFPLWLTPKPDTQWLTGYNGSQHPFAALYFNPDFQAQYKKWLKALLTTPGPNGRRLVDEPAVMGLELVNEDSLFFWTFSDKNLPVEQMNLLQSQFGLWLERRYGTIGAAIKKWNSQVLPGDKPESGRMVFRPLWNMANERTLRDQDTARFLWETQTRFYRDMIAYVRGLGFKGLVTPSNWTTADNRVFGPLEKMSYAVGDFIDRHGYFSCDSQGENSDWSIRAGHTYADRSALRFDPEKPGKPRSIVHPAMDPTYDDKPSMISETTWNRPNRYRSEAPLYFATFGALQDTDAIIHFALDGIDWSPKPGYWTQPWTLMAPSQMGQFPAAALIYRRGLIQPGGNLASIRLNRADLFALKGTPMPQDASFDELRLKDVPTGASVQPGQVIDPLTHYAGRTSVTFADSPSTTLIDNSSGLVDHTTQTVTSTTGEVRLDYGHGLLWLTAPQAQGVSGNLAFQSILALPDLTIESPMDLAHVVVVSLDGKPLAKSGRILLQVMSEEHATGWKTAAAENGKRRIVDLGKDPWQVKEITGQIHFRRPDAKSLQVSALNFQGKPVKEMGTADSLQLDPRTLYYLIEKR
jgi:hypothetical protein